MKGAANSLNPACYLEELCWIPAGCFALCNQQALPSAGSLHGICCLYPYPTRVFGKHSSGRLSCFSMPSSADAHTFLPLAKLPSASCQSERALLCGASAVTRFCPHVPETERGESSQAWPTRWCSADSSDANCNFQCFTSFMSIPGTGKLGHCGLACKTCCCLPLVLTSLGRRAKLLFSGILGLSPNILIFSVSHQETTVLFLIFFFLL